MIGTNKSQYNQAGSSNSSFNASSHATSVLDEFEQWINEPSFGQSGKFSKPKEYPINTPSHQRYPKWLAWQKNFIQAVILSRIKDPNEIAGMLYTSVGDEIRLLIDTLALSDNKGIDLCRALTEHFKAGSDPTQDIETLRNLKQSPRESAQEFLIRLRQQAAICELGSNNSYIVVALRSGLLNRDVARLSKLNNWDEQMTVMAAERDKDIEPASFLTKTAKVDRVASPRSHSKRERSPPERSRDFDKKQKTFDNRSNSNWKKVCNGCGGSCNKRANCPAQGKTCDNCNKPNHFAKVCRGPKKVDNVGDKAVNEVTEL